MAITHFDCTAVYANLMNDAAVDANNIAAEEKNRKETKKCKCTWGRVSNHVSFLFLTRSFSTGWINAALRSDATDYVSNPFTSHNFLFQLHEDGEEALSIAGFHSLHQFKSHKMRSISY